MGAPTPPISSMLIIGHPELFKHVENSIFTAACERCRARHQITPASAMTIGQQPDNQKPVICCYACFRVLVETHQIAPDVANIVGVQELRRRLNLAPTSANKPGVPSEQRINDLGLT